MFMNLCKVVESLVNNVFKRIGGHKKLQALIPHYHRNIASLYGSFLTMGTRDSGAMYFTRTVQLARNILSDSKTTISPLLYN